MPEVFGVLYVLVVDSAGTGGEARSEKEIGIMEKDGNVAYFDRARGKWRVDLSEMITRDTAKEAEAVAEKRIAIYREAIKKAGL